MQENTVFSVLNAVNCNEHVEKKGNLSYLSWAWAWQMVKQHYPDASYTIYENPDGWNYLTDGRTCWVKTGVTIAGLEHIEHLPIMDQHNHPSGTPAPSNHDIFFTSKRREACVLMDIRLTDHIIVGEEEYYSFYDEKTYKIIS